MYISQLSLLFLTSLLPLSLATQVDQITMNLHDRIEYAPQTSSKPTLADLLTVETSASIFYSYARELELSKGLADPDLRMTLFVPTNKAVMALSRKPHQNPPTIDQGIEISEQDYDKLTKSNVERWVTAHIVPEAPIPLESTHRTMLPGKSLTFKPIGKSGNDGPEWSRVTLENGVHIVAKKEALNGDLYVIDGTVTPTTELD